MDTLVLLRYISLCITTYYFCCVFHYHCHGNYSALMQNVLFEVYMHVLNQYLANQNVCNL